MIEYIIGAILLILFLALVCLASIATIRINHVKCPKCGTDMDYIGNQIDIGEGFPITDNSKYRYLGYPHVYRCPKCGKIKTI